MSSICKAGIFVDVKQLMEFTDQMVCAMKNADRIKYGDKLVQYNLDMVTNFTMAYHRRDEHISFIAGEKRYDVNLKGEKRSHVEALEAAFTNYQTVMEFCFEHNKFSDMKKRKRRRKKNQFIDLMGKLNTGIVKWSRSLYKQVIVSEQDTLQADIFKEVGTDSFNPER